MSCRHPLAAFDHNQTACWPSIASEASNLAGVCGWHDDEQYYVRFCRHVFLSAFDLLELDGKDPRREPIEVRKATLASVLRGCRSELQFNQHFAHPGDIVFRHACKMGLEGIVSKRLGSRYTSGRSKDWLKFKNPEAPAVKREAEEDWGRGGWR